MHKVLISSSQPGEAEFLKQRLVRLTSDLGPIDFSGVDLLRVGEVLSPRTNLTVVSVPDYDLLQKRKLVYEIRSTGYNGPVVMISNFGEAEAFQTAKGWKGVVLIEQPATDSDLLGVTRKFLLARTVAQRVFRRYPTQQKARIEFYDREEGIDTVLMNLSKGGAYFEFQEQCKVSVGDMLRLNIELDQVHRSYAMAAKVVWTTRQVQSKGQRGVGVEFVGPDDVYKYLLEG